MRITYARGLYDVPRARGDRENDEGIERERKRRAMGGGRVGEDAKSSSAKKPITNDLRMQAISCCAFCAIVGTPRVSVTNGGICPERC